MKENLWCTENKLYAACNGLVSFHYENMSMQYTAIFHGRKNDNFQLIVLDYFHIFAQNIICGYTLKPPH